WANTDPNAVARVNNNGRSGETTERGKETTRWITGNDVASHLIFPPASYCAHATTFLLLFTNHTARTCAAVACRPNQAALLAQTGRTPQTTAYTDPWLRYDFTTDSVHARDLTAASAVFLGDAAHNENAEETNDSDSSPQVIKLPNYLEPSTAEAVL